VIHCALPKLGRAADLPLTISGERIEYRVVFADGLSAANLDT
jgi:hypothetical protein